MNEHHSQNHEPGDSSPTARQDRLRHAIDRAAHLLPAQGPITVFIHHNTLHAFEHLPFHEAVRLGGATFGCEPYLSEQRYREALNRGRIRFSDLQAVLERELRDRPGAFPERLGRREDFLLAMLEYPHASGSAEELRWFVAETDALRKVRREASAASRAKLIAESRRWVLRDLRIHSETHRKLPTWAPELFRKFGASRTEDWTEETWEAFALETLWRVCCASVAEVASPPPVDRPLVRHRDLLLRTRGVDTDPMVHDALIRFTAAFLDQGVSHWPLPERDRGYLAAFCSLYRGEGRAPNACFRGLPAELARIQDLKLEPLQVVQESFETLGVLEPEWDAYLSATLLALRGWGGMIREVETRADRVARPIPAGSLIEFIAVRLVLERFALAHAIRVEAIAVRSLAELRDVLRREIRPVQPAGVEERAFPIFQLAQILGWTPDELYRLTSEGWAALLREIAGFDEIDRRRVFHLAYEKRFRDQCLDALLLHTRRKQESPRFQVVTCLDEREESFRRHLEEIAPECETFGAAGFYAVAMYYKGAADAHFVPLCPVVIRPQHYVEERVDESHAEEDRRSRRYRRTIGRASHWMHVGTRGFGIGAILSASIGVLASIPLVGRIMFPGLAARLRKRAGSLFRTPKGTRLQLERSDPTPGPEGNRVGFTLEEMTNIGERVLRDIGLIRDFARLVLTIGHGSHSMNNPHESAHDCGACGGSVGGPNGRAIAQILNDPRVRAGLDARGLTIPTDTVFVGGLHNTCNEYVKFFDLDRLPASHRELFERVEAAIDETLDRNSHERARRFVSAPLSLSPAGARQHMDARAEDLAQVRPEWGHATNAFCIVGRRERTRGLFLDRRSFLVSYDPAQDDANGAILARTMAAVFPVCGGINLEYYFCHVDNAGYGSGTKLPHNITSLLGVMDGAMSDLRTGLPWQMVEIHEPVRLLIVCETTAAIMKKVLDGNPLGKMMTEKGWIQLAIQSPDTNDLHVYEDGAFRPYEVQADRLPSAPSSMEWYRGWRDHLEFAEIGK